MTFTVGENFNINVGKDLITPSGRNRTTTLEVKDKLQAMEVFETINENKTVKIGQDLSEITATTTHKAEHSDIFVQSDWFIVY
ncbi:hypothetical protein NJT12_23565 [Flavobacterium sp. AC]|uniref:Uncharacterized protein n=1 Tax=Flavobacterium azizsancarii TaxID=2961580 RepID=A0ABT4WJ32_9FLAO|nr:hypothetical protein [Flavobacterium azizsancarii]MDA6072604.1 hypothetical protein [Flavobacterium azizsancarii]